MYAVYRTTNTIILYLILSTISIFIPVSGGVGRGQVHCFAQGGGAIMLLRRPWIRGVVRLIWSVRTPPPPWAKQCTWPLPTPPLTGIKKIEMVDKIKYRIIVLVVL
jgi:hypothetical protein